MRIFTFAAITVAFVASVAGKFGFGPCREDVPQLAYADYEADTAYNHILFAMDHDFFELANVLDNLGFKFPLENWRCDDLNTISPFKELAEEQETDDFFFDEDTFNLFFPERTDAVLKYAKNGESGGDFTDIVYLCMDTFSAPAIIEQARAFGLNTADSAISA